MTSNSFRLGLSHFVIDHLTGRTGFLAIVVRRTFKTQEGEPRKPRGKVCTSLYKQEVSVQTQYLVRLNAIPEEIDRDMNGRRIR